MVKTLSNLKRRIAAAVMHDKSLKRQFVGSKLSQCPFHLSITSLDKQPDSGSIDTVITWLDEGSDLQEIKDNHHNERFELSLRVH